MPRGVAWLLFCFSLWLGCATVPREPTPSELAASFVEEVAKVVSEKLQAEGRNLQSPVQVRVLEVLPSAVDPANQFTLHYTISFLEGSSAVREAVPNPAHSEFTAKALVEKRNGKWEVVKNETTGQSIEFLEVE